MLKINVDNIGDLAVVECESRIVQSDAAFKLREAVTLQGDARTVVLDLSEVNAIEGGGLGIREQLAYVLSCSKCQRILGQWTTAEDRDTELRKFAENVS